MDASQNLAWAQRDLSQMETNRTTARAQRHICLDLVIKIITDGLVHIDDTNEG